MKRTIAILLATVLLLSLCPAKSYANELFSDVPSGCWYEEAVAWAVEHQMTSGVGDGKFGPNVSVTRAQVVQMLWKHQNSPAASEDAPFSDVPNGKWYSAAVAWAAEKKIVAGLTDGTFRPNKDISREELVTILYSYARYLDSTVTAPNLDLSGYEDADSIASYAKAAMRWAVANGIVSGTSPTKLSPKAGATRAQLVQMLYRFLGNNPDEWELPIQP